MGRVACREQQAACISVHEARRAESVNSQAPACAMRWLRWR